MAASLIEIADGLETRLATVSGLRVFNHVPDVFAPPCAFVMPDSVQYWRGFAGGNIEYAYTVTVIVGRTNERSSQRSLYNYISFDGDLSIRAAIEGDRTLGGIVNTLLVERGDNIRMLSQGDTDYLAADFSVTVHG